LVVVVVFTTVGVAFEVVVVFGVDIGLGVVEVVLEDDAGRVVEDGSAGLDEDDSVVFVVDSVFVVNDREVEDE